jgi:hypothetical protein
MCRESFRRRGNRLEYQDCCERNGNDRRANTFPTLAAIENFISSHFHIARHQQPMPDVLDRTNKEQASSRPERVDENADDRPSKRRRRESEDRHRREIGLMRQSDGAKAPSFVGSSSGIHFVRSVYHALAKSRVQLLPQTPDQSIVPGEEDQLEEAVPYSSKKLWTTNEIDTINTGLLDFDFDDLQTWSESYFDNWHTAYPFVHAPTILETLEQHIRPGNLTTVGNQLSSQFTIIRSIMSISLADQRQAGHQFEKPIPACLVFTSFREAMESVQDMLFLPSSIDALQAVVSVQLFLVSMLRLNGASRLGGMIVRMAFQLGLHRCPARYADFDAGQAGLRRRLFWSVYCIDRYLCQSLGLPLTIRDDDVDVCYFDEEKHATDGHSRTTMDGRLRTLNFLARHASIKGQIMELRNKSIHQRTTNRDLATLIGARIDKFGNDLQYIMDAAEFDNSDCYNTLHDTVLLVSQHELIISLNRPLLAMEKHTSEYAAALQTCIRASRAVISILHRYFRAHVNEQFLHRAPLLFPSFTWCVWQSSFIVLHAALEGEMPKPTARRLADDSVEVLRHFALRGSVWPNVCAVAINDLFLRLLLDSAVTTPQSPSLDANHSEQERNMNFQRSVGSVAPSQDVTNRRKDPRPGTHSRTSGGEHTFSNHTTDVSEPFPLTFDPQPSIPWISGTDAAATTTANIFEQFDIPFWMGDDQYSSLLDFDL